MDNIKMGNAIKKFRNAKGLTGESLAEIVNREPETIRQIEAGTSSTVLPTLLAICRALDTTPSNLMAGDLNKSLNNRSSEYIELLELIDQLSPREISILEDVVNTMIKNRSLYRKTTTL